MVTRSELELILKWNTSLNYGRELVLERQKGENYSVNYDEYHIEGKKDNATKDNVCRNGSFETINENDLICDLKTDYDSVEISVVIILFLLIVVTVIGNTLIISAVVTTKRLRTVTNCFVTSLAAADLLVGIFVMPPAIAVHITGKWTFFAKGELTNSKPRTFLFQITFMHTFINIR